jgi:predicted metal-binding protein
MAEEQNLHMSRALIFCETCRYTKESKTREDGMTGDALLSAKVQERLAESGRHDVTVRTQRCLWLCARHCYIRD